MKSRTIGVLLLRSQFSCRGAALLLQRFRRPEDLSSWIITYLIYSSDYRFLGRRYLFPVQQNSAILAEPQRGIRAQRVNPEGVYFRIAFRVQINYLHMSSDEENGPAIYDDDDSNEDYRHSIASGRNSYNIGSTTEEPTFSNPNQQEKPHQQEESHHLETATEATEEKTAREHHDPAQAATTGFHKKEEASAIQSYDQSTYQVLLASQVPPEPTQEDDPTLKSIRPEDLIEENVHQNEPPSEQIFNATAEEIQNVEPPIHQEEHERQKQNDEVQQLTKEEQPQEAAIQQAQEVERLQQVPQEPAQVAAQPIERRTESQGEPGPQDIVESERKQEQAEGNAQMRGEEGKETKEEDIEPSRFETTEQRVVQQAVEPEQIEEPREGSQVPDEVAQFVKVEEAEVPQTNQQQQTEPVPVHPEPEEPEVLPVQQQTISQPQEVHEEAARQQLHQQVDPHNHPEENAQHQEQVHHQEVLHNQQSQIPQQIQEQVPTQQEQVPPHHEQVPPHHEQVPTQQEQIPTQQEQIATQQEQVPNQPQQESASNHEEVINPHRQEKQSHPSNIESNVEPVNEQLSSHTKQEVPSHQKQLNLEHPHQEAPQQGQVRQEPVSSQAFQAREENVSEFSRKKKDKQIVNIEPAANYQQIKPEVQIHQQSEQREINKQTDEVAQRQKEIEVPTEVQTQHQHQKTQIQASPVVVTVEPTNHPLSRTHSEKVAEKPDALVEEQRESAPLVESKQPEPAGNVSAGTKSPIESEPQIKSKGEPQVIRVEPVQIENQRDLARQAGMGEIKRSIPAPTRQNVPRTEKSATGNSETCKCEIM